MKDKKLIFVIIYTAARCELKTQYIQTYLHDALSYLNRLWKNSFDENYSEEKMIDEIINVCFSRKQRNCEEFPFWVDKQESENTSVFRKVVAILETIINLNSYDAPVSVNMSHQKLSSALDYTINIDYDVYHLMNVRYKEFIELLSIGSKWKLGQWIGHDRILTSHESIFIKQTNLLFSIPHETNGTGFFFPFISKHVKVEDLDFSPLEEKLMHNHRYQYQWEHAQTNIDRLNLFVTAIDEVWEEVYDSAHCLWGG